MAGAIQPGRLGVMPVLSTDQCRRQPARHAAGQPDAVADHINALALALVGERNAHFVDMVTPTLRFGRRRSRWRLRGSARPGQRHLWALIRNSNTDRDPHVSPPGVPMPWA